MRAAALINPDERGESARGYPERRPRRYRRVSALRLAKGDGSCSIQGGVTGLAVSSASLLGWLSSGGTFSLGGGGSSS